MKLPIPIIYGDNKFIDVEICRPSGGILADTKKAIDAGNVFSAMNIFVAGCITNLIGDSNSIQDERQIRNICRHMPYKTNELLFIQILLLQYNGEGAIEGVYTCPRCYNKIIAEESPIEGDTRDYIQDLEIGYLEGDNYFETILSDSFQIKTKKGELLFDITKIGFRHPTMDDHIQACAMYGDRDSVRLQYAIYAKCIESINGQVIDNQFRSNWGEYIFEKYRNVTDVNKIASEMNRYGYQTKVEKHCTNCGKIWKEHLNTANFFVSALQSQSL